MATFPDFLTQLDALEIEAAELFALPAERLIRQPTPSTWSALQCVEHLILTSGMYVPAINEAVRRAKGKGALRTTPFCYSPFERFIVRATEPPPRVKVPAPKPTMPTAPPTDVPAIQQAYYNSHMQLQRCISEALEIDLRKAKVKSQLRWRPTVNAGFAFGIILAHERRHLYQARQAAQ